MCCTIWLSKSINLEISGTMVKGGVSSGGQSGLFGTSYVSAHDHSSCHSLRALLALLFYMIYLFLLLSFLSSFHVVTCLFLVLGSYTVNCMRIRTTLLSILLILGRNCILVLFGTEICSGSRCAARRRFFPPNYTVL